jgi:AT-binding transcription factor 1
MDTSTEESNETSHDNSSKSKSLLHSTFSRKSDGKSGMNYPLEKYLDPNRPYKCDVCKESFTQKNILLVHYNSVSHLHRLKKSMQNELLSGGGAGGGGLQTPEKSPSPRVMTSLESALSNLANAKQIRDDESEKPYKCNICRVSYNQGSTLDIHIRSVLHQTRASKLQELALSGQIDLSKPLIEQPDSKQLQEQHKKILQDMLSPKSSFNSSSSSSSNPALSPPQAAAPPVPAPSSPLLNLQQALLNAKHQQQNLTPPHPASIIELLSGNANEQSQQQFLQFLQTLQQGSTTGNNNNDGPHQQQQQQQQQQQEEQTLAEGRKPQQPQTAVKNLLENYGLELVMQFNENHKRRLREEEKRKQEEENALKSDNQSNMNEGMSNIDTSMRKDGDDGDDEETRGKETSIKDHNEEEHRNYEAVPLLFFIMVFY